MTFATYLRCSIIIMQWNCCLHCSVLIIYLYIPLVSVFWRTSLLFCPVPTMEMFTAQLFDPMTLLGFAMFGIFLYCVKDETRTLTTGESLAANWHLWNGE